MRKLMLIFSLTVLLAACDKKQENDDILVTCLNTHSWLDGILKEYKNCVCLTALMTGTYQGETFFEIKIIDPLCDGINVVYKDNGQQWFSSADKSTYDDYVASADRKEIWRCLKAGN